LQPDCNLPSPLIGAEGFPTLRIIYPTAIGIDDMHIATGLSASCRIS